MSDFQRVCVVGLGYIGLPTASLLATKGFEVQGVDVNPDVVDTINAGDIHIVEPELDILVRSAVQSGRLEAALKPEPADVFILAVPTPFREEHKPDLQFVEAGARLVAGVLEAGNLVILESTSPVGTTESVLEWIREERPDLDGESLHLAHCPERVLPGDIIRELVANDRVVGGITPEATERAAEFYRTFVAGTVFPTDSRTAELVKLAENTYRDVNIAFANELSRICGELEVDVWELVGLANHHPRVNILEPGPGVGGHCLAVDPWFVVDSAPETARLIRTAREVNDHKPAWVARQVLGAAQAFRSARGRDPTISCFGLTYKADVDDLRGSPAVEVIRSLAEAGAGRVLVTDPYVPELPPALNGSRARLVGSAQALEEGDIAVGLVDHRLFRRIPPASFSGKVVVDARGMWR